MMSAESGRKPTSSRGTWDDVSFHIVARIHTPQSVTGNAVLVPGSARREEAGESRPLQNHAIGIGFWVTHCLGRRLRAIWPSGWLPQSYQGRGQLMLSFRDAECETRMGDVETAML
jgi:hypothetical protein